MRNKDIETREVLYDKWNDDSIQRFLLSIAAIYAGKTTMVKWSL